MDIKPNIRSNFGPLSPRAFNKIAAKANERTTKDATRDLSSGTKVFIARISTVTDVITNKRWKYGWVEVLLKSSTKRFQDKDSHLKSATGTEAYNTCESLQQDNGGEIGPGFDFAHIPTGFLLKPIRVGTCVIMLQTRDDLGNVCFVFTLSNAIDGVCSYI